MNPKARLGLALVPTVLIGWLACSSTKVPCYPLAETCNGLDDDCDMIIDNNLTDVTGKSCGSSVGECQPGHEACVGGKIACAGEMKPTDEVCNHADDNCDGETDETLEACACQGGQPPVPEVCNGVDDDCNQAIDDLSHCACTGGASPSNEVCNRADDDCNQFIDDLPRCACTGGSPPGDEVCNYIDDDCNETIDDGISGCACTGGNPPGGEICNTIDDDCDGVIDDGISACACTGGNPPGGEVCNTIDDDCDEQIDEDNGSGGTCGGFGDPCGSYRDCSSQICVGDAYLRYCSQECNPSDSLTCPADYRCHVGPNLDYCLRNFPACSSDADCSPNQVCTVQDSPDGLSKVTECRPPLSPGGNPGEDCSTSQCANDLCIWIDICSEVCTQPATDCPNQYLGHTTTCILRGFRVTPGECGRDAQCPTGYTCQTSSCRGPACADDAQCVAGYGCDPTNLVCLPKPFLDYLGLCLIECQGDIDCPTGLVCQAGVLADGTKVQGFCYPLYNGNPTGDPCGQGCDHGICYYPSVGTEYCTQICGDASDCPTGMGCTPGTLHLGSLGSFPNTFTCTI